MTDVTRYLWVGQITTDPQGTLVSFADYAALRDELLHTEMERDSAEMRSVAHLKMYVEASQQLAELKATPCTRPSVVPPPHADTPD